MGEQNQSCGGPGLADNGLAAVARALGVERRGQGSRGAEERRGECFYDLARRTAWENAVALARSVEQGSEINSSASWQLGYLAGLVGALDMLVKTRMATECRSLSAEIRGWAARAREGKT